MDIPRQENVTSIEAIRSTIKIDSQAYQWFAFLIVQPEIKSRLGKNAYIRKLYGDLRKIILIQMIAYLFLLGSLPFIVLLKYYFFLPAAIIPAYFATRFHFKKKTCVSKISIHLVSEDFDLSILRNTTLYQICEQYSQRYNIPSLVDAIYRSDITMRYVVFFVSTIALLILSFPPIPYCLALFFLYHIANALLKTNMVYQRLK